jgi:hypothetical protein
MAEWTGRKRTLISIITQGEPPVDAASDHLPPPPQAPGATNSPQLPGATPDNPDLPGWSRGSTRPLASNRRPLTEYGSAQRLLRLFTPEPGADLTPSDWEQGPSAGEEVRKADPALLTPFRPLEGYGLGIGRSVPALPAEEFEALSGADEPVPPDPAVAHPIEPALIPAAASTATAQATTMEMPAGAIRGDGTAACPPGFPVKGNAQSKIYHTNASRVYEQTIAELCFATPEAAEAAGFRAPKNA